AVREQPGAMLADEGAAMAEPDHVRLADILIDAARAGREIGEGMILPARRRIILGISEVAALMRDDPHRDQRIGEALRELAGRRLRPPFGHMRTRPPCR